MKCFTLFISQPFQNSIDLCPQNTVLCDARISIILLSNSNSTVSEIRIVQSLYCANYTYKMVLLIINLISSCFNKTLHAFTRLTLICLSALIYHCFIFVEVFLNSYNLLYPPVLEKRVARVQKSVSSVSSFCMRVAAKKVYLHNYINILSVCSSIITIKQIVIQSKFILKLVTM